MSEKHVFDEQSNEMDKKKQVGKKSRQRTVLTEEQLATLKCYYTQYVLHPVTISEQACMCLPYWL